MRILIYSYNYYPEPIGIAPLMTELAEGLASRGHEVRVVTGMPNYPQRQIYDEYRGKLYLTEQKNGVVIQRSYVWVKPQPGLIDRILLDASFILTSFPQALAGWRPCVIFVTVPPLPVSLPATLLSWFYQCPVVLNVQDILPDAAIQVGLLKNKSLIKIFQLLEKVSYRTATTISVIADGFVDNLRIKGVPSHKIARIANWVDTDFICPLPTEESLFRQEHKLQGKFVVMYSGNIALTQGLETAIEAAFLLQHIQDIVFVIVGEEKALVELERLCVKRELNNVLLLPFQPRHQLPQMLAAADVGLVLQRHNVISFNMPSKIPVLLASGRAILASVPSTGTAAQVVKASQGGIVVSPEDPAALAEAIQSLYQNPLLTQKLGCQGRQYALNNFAFEKILDRYESLLSDLTAVRSNLTPGSLENNQSFRRLSSMCKSEEELKAGEKLAKVSLDNYTTYAPTAPLWKQILWYFFGDPLFRSRWLFFSALKVWILRCFGATIGSNVRIKPNVTVKFPWQLTIGDYSWIGEKAWFDNIAPITIESHVCISQEVYLCTGNHDWSHPNFSLTTGSIYIKQGSWIAARSAVGPGVTVGQGAVLTMGSVSGRSLEPMTIYAGNPAQPIKTRVLKDHQKVEAMNG